PHPEIQKLHCNLRVKRQSVDVNHSDVFRKNSLQNLGDVHDLMVLQIELRNCEVIDQRVELDFWQVAGDERNSHEYEEIPHQEKLQQVNPPGAFLFLKWFEP